MAMADSVHMEGARPVLYHGAGPHTDAVWQALSQQWVGDREIVSRIDELRERSDVPAVLLLDRHLLAASQPGDAEGLSESLDSLPEGVVVVAADDVVAGKVADSHRVLFTVPSDGEHRPEDILLMLQAGIRHAAVSVAADRSERELARTREELRELNRIGMALMTERDPDRLLVEILEQARRLTQSDAGTLFLVERSPDGNDRLRFKLARNDTLPDLQLEEYTLPLDQTSLAGYVASTRKPLVLDDAYRIPAGVAYTLNRSFDERIGYRTKSMLVVPMLDHKDVVVGVLQLINRKRDGDARIEDEASAEAYVLPYGEREVQVVRSLAGQAAVSVENSMLYREIERMFESFVKASVSAIDQRDPTTAGHSMRVAALTCDMAQGLANYDKGPYAGTRFTVEQMRELRYAGLLHDFGKVGVREHVLVKSHKLPPALAERLDARFDLMRQTFAMEYHRLRADARVREGGSDHQEASMAGIEADYRDRLEELDRMQAAVRTANEPGGQLDGAGAELLRDMAGRSFQGPGGESLPYLTEEEWHYLSIPRGTLDESERTEIESHVEQTLGFLQHIPWSDDLDRLVDIAYSHHEKLNGGGYPRGISADDIPLQARMMTIADIFDALTAADRPYKKAMSAQRALEVLMAEAQHGALDKDLVEYLADSQIYRRILEVDWREL